MFNKIKLVSTSMPPPISTKEEKVLMILNSDEINKLSNAPFIIKSIELMGEESEIKVSYVGGCKTHDFMLFVADKILIDSQPTSINLNLSHDDGGDRCKSIVTEKLVFDLSPLTKYIPHLDHKRTVKISIGDKTVEFDPT